MASPADEVDLHRLDSAGLVSVAGGSVHAQSVYVLRGGIQAWIEEVMNPTITADASPAAHIAFQRASAVSRYFVDARVLSIFEGADETLCLKVIARRLVEQRD